MKPARLLRATLTLQVLATLALGLGCSHSSGSAAPSASDYCAAVADYIQKCSLYDACSNGVAATCTQTAQTSSPAFLTAFVDCEGISVCPAQQDGGVAEQPGKTCYAQKLASFPPSAAHQKYAQDYCTSCASSFGLAVADCANGFYTTVDGGTGLGAFLVDYSDSIVSKLDTDCVVPLGANATPDACNLTVFGCINNDFANMVPQIPACSSNTTTPPTSAADGG